MSDRFRVSAVLCRQLEDLGLSIPEVLRRAGLPLNLFESSRIWVNTRELFALYSAIREVSGDPAVGLKLGSEDRVERYSPLAITALYSRNFGEALGRFSRYKRITGPEEIHIDSQGDQAAVRFVWLLAEEPEPPAVVDTCFARVTSIGERGTGRAIRPLAVEFTRSPAEQALYEDFFGCPVRFGQPQNRLILQASDLSLPFVTHNSDMLELVAPQLEAELRQHLEDTSLRQQVKGILRKQLTGQRPGLEEVARELGVSARTLQRRLLLERLKFHSLVEEARREMAQHYLLHSSMELDQTAFLLGYQDPNSFIRAFHKWEGTSPGVWRSNQRQEAAS